MSGNDCNPCPSTIILRALILLGFKNIFCTILFPLCENVSDPPASVIFTRHTTRYSGSFLFTGEGLFQKEKLFPNESERVWKNIRPGLSLDRAGDKARLNALAQEYIYQQSRNCRN